MANKISEEAQRRLTDALAYLEREIEIQRPGIAALRIEVVAVGIPTVGLSVAIQVHSVGGKKPEPEQPSAETTKSVEDLLAKLKPKPHKPAPPEV